MLHNLSRFARDLFRSEVLASTFLQTSSLLLAAVGALFLPTPQREVTSAVSVFLALVAWAVVVWERRMRQRDAGRQERDIELQPVRVLRRSTQ